MSKFFCESKLFEAVSNLTGNGYASAYISAQLLVHVAVMSSFNFQLFSRDLTEGSLIIDGLSLILTVLGSRFKRITSVSYYY